MSAEKKPYHSDVHYTDVLGAAACGIVVLVMIATSEHLLIMTNKTKEDAVKTNYVCELKDICSQYPDERYNCASAGNYEKCMSIRMKADNYTKANEFCSDDGSINAPPSEIPNFLECKLAAFKLAAFR
jgi:hypothetical protein